MSFKFSIINGPNLNWLGKREKEIYGEKTWDAIWKDLLGWASPRDISLNYFQSNTEGVLIDHLQEINSKVDGVVFNPGAYAHTSIALRDCVASLDLPVVEVHLSKIHQREPFRSHSYIAEVAAACIVGFGEKGYLLALEFLQNLMRHEHSQQR